MLEGLEDLTQLSELHIAHQRLEEGEKLLFDPRTLKAISVSSALLRASLYLFNRTISGHVPIPCIEFTNTSECDWESARFN